MRERWFREREDVDERERHGYRRRYNSQYSFARRSLGHRGSSREIRGRGFSFRRESRKRIWTENHPQPSETIFVENIPKQATWRWLLSVFKYFGKVREAFVPGKTSSRGLKYGFVKFRSTKEAENALRATNGRKIAGHSFAVSFAWSKERVQKRFDNDDQPKPTDQRTGNPRSCELELDKHMLEKLKTCLIGKTRIPISQARIQQELDDHGLNEIRLVRISIDDYIICFEQGSIRDTLEKEEWATLKQWSIEIQIWSPNFSSPRRTTIIRISNLPLVFWNRENIMKLLHPWGQLSYFISDIEKPIDTRWCLVTIETELKQKIKESVHIRCGEIHVVSEIDEVLERLFDNVNSSCSGSEDSVREETGEEDSMGEMGSRGGSAVPQPVCGAVDGHVTDNSPLEPGVINEVITDSCSRYPLIGKNNNETLGNRELNADGRKYRSFKEACMVNLNMGQPSLNILHADQPSQSNEKAPSSPHIFCNPIITQAPPMEDQTISASPDHVSPTLQAQSSHINNSDPPPKQDPISNLDLVPTDTINHIQLQSSPHPPQSQPNILVPENQADLPPPSEEHNGENQVFKFSTAYQSALKRKIKKKNIQSVDGQTISLQKRTGKKKQKRNNVVVVFSNNTELESRGEESVSDGHIRSSNSRFWKIAEDVWQIGKEIGIQVNNEEDEVLKSLAKICAESEQRQV